MCRLPIKENSLLCGKSSGLPLYCCACHAQQVYSPAMPNDEFESGPYLNAALLCERTIEEPDGVLTLVRLVDKVTAGPTPGAQAEQEFQPFPVRLSLVVVLRRGDATGTYEVKVRPREPDGTELQASGVQVAFPGDDPGEAVNVLINMGLGVQFEGLYWFDILINDRVVSRLSLRIEFQRAAGQQPLVPPERENDG